MNTKATEEAESLLKQTLRELETPKGSVATAVRRLLRAASILADREAQTWCQIQLGEPKYSEVLTVLLEKYIASEDEPDNANAKKALTDAYRAVKEAGIRLGRDITNEELTLRATPAGGGFASIEFVEERYADLVRLKRWDDGTYYKTSLLATLHHARNRAHAEATRLYGRIAYADSPQTSFDALKTAIDDRLLDVAPGQAEQLMVAFRAVSSDTREAWSQALATCRRVIEGLADALFPPRAKDINGRELGEKQYINRLWAYMDAAISSESNRELAKRHVDYLGAYLERIHKMTNKGVHSEVTRVEAVKAVFHTYLVIGDLLEYLPSSTPPREHRLNIHIATLDELESVGGLTRDAAKEVIKLRVAKGVLTPVMLKDLKGIGPKKLRNLEAAFSFESPGPGA